MRLSGVFICILVVALDVAAGILGIHAYMAQNQVKHVHLFLFQCSEPSHDAFKLGVAAAAILLIAHLIANIAGGCICYGSKAELRSSPVNRQIAGISLMLSWIILGIAFTLLILGAMSNNHSRDYCSVSRHKFLWMGGVLCFVHGAIIAAYYIAATATIMGDRGIKGLSMAERG
jgi:hypothetical protein